MVEANIVWFIWDPIMFLTFYLASFGFWYITRKGRLVVDNDNGTATTTNIKNPFWIGLSISCFSFFAIGLYSLLLIAIYFLSVGLVKVIHNFKKIE